MAPCPLWAYPAAMPHTEGPILPTRAGLTPDVLALGQALLDGDAAEARFRTHIVLRTAEAAGFWDVVRLGRPIEARLIAPGPYALTGIGEAYAALLDAVSSSA